MATKRGRKLYQCSDCLKDFQRHPDLVKHMEIHALEKKYKCYVYLQDFVKDSHLVKHSGVNKGEKQYCSEDASKCSSQSNMLIHSTLHKPLKKQQQSSQCRKNSSNKRSHDQHMRVHNLKKLHQCSKEEEPECSDKSSFTTDMKVHTKETSNQSSKCLKDFSNKESLAKNITQCSEETECSDKSNLATNMKVCKTETSNQGLESLKGFSAKESPGKNITVNTVDKPFKCSQCPKTYLAHGYLLQHTRVHTGEKPFKCLFCPKKFSLHQTRQRHTRIHEKNGSHSGKSNLIPHDLAQTEKNTYKCSECPKSFRRYSNLEKHNRFHTGEKPHQCSVCLKNFTLNPHLFCGFAVLKHLRTHIRKKQTPSSESTQDSSNNANLTTGVQVYTKENTDQSSTSKINSHNKEGSGQQTEVEIRDKSYQYSEIIQDLSQRTEPVKHMTHLSPVVLVKRLCIKQ
nr:zinc finger protein 501-like [Cherax quadricarinatus]